MNMLINSEVEPVECRWIWDVPFHPLTFAEAVGRVDDLVVAGRPSYFITANLNYVMLTAQEPRLRDVNRGAAFVVADGITLVWASRREGRPLPERVTGADLVYGLCDLAARRGYRPFFLGGPPGVAEQAATRLRRLYPGLEIAGTACPPFRDLSVAEHAGLIAAIRDARPDMLFVAFGQPKGEIWIARHLQELGVPVCAQVGAALDFVAGRVRRAPPWMQRNGLETPFRIIQEPRRLSARYARNALFLARMLGRDAYLALLRRASRRLGNDGTPRGGEQSP